MPRTAGDPPPRVETQPEPAASRGETTPDRLDHAALTPNGLTILAETFRLLGDPSRLKILLSCMSGPISVGEIAEKTDLSVSLVSHHLRLLRGARLVKGERQSKQVFYAIADAHVRQVLHDMATHISEDHPES